jgi:hypothetical protein
VTLKSTAAVLPPFSEPKNSQFFDTSRRSPLKNSKA